MPKAVKLPSGNWRVRVDLPRKIKQEIDIPSKEDVQRLLTAAQCTPLESAILLAAGYGLRRGEISALCFSDIDCNACTIHISNSYAGTRTISVSANLIDRLYSNRIDPQRVLPFPPSARTPRPREIAAFLVSPGISRFSGVSLSFISFTFFLFVHRFSKKRDTKCDTKNAPGSISQARFYHIHIFSVPSGGFSPEIFSPAMICFKSSSFHAACSASMTASLSMLNPRSAIFCKASFHFSSPQ